MSFLFPFSFHVNHVTICSFHFIKTYKKTRPHFSVCTGLLLLFAASSIMDKGAAVISFDFS